MFLFGNVILAYSQDSTKVQKAVDYMLYSDCAEGEEKRMLANTAYLISNSSTAEVLFIEALQNGLPKSELEESKKSTYEVYKMIRAHLKTDPPEGLSKKEIALALKNDPGIEADVEREVQGRNIFYKIRAINGLALVGGARSISILQNALKNKELEDAARQALTAIKIRQIGR